MTRQQLKQYALKKLGHPVINVELENSQMDNLIDEALQLFTENHYDGVDLDFIPVNVQANVQQYILGDNIQEVIEVINPRTLFISDEPLLLRSLYSGNTGLESIASSQINFADITTMRMLLKMMEDSYKSDILFDYNYTTRTFRLHTKPTQNAVYYVRCYMSEQDLSKYYNNLWLKKYVTVLFKEQWATNVGKYTGGMLPGGASIDYSRLMQEAREDKLKLEEDLRLQYQEPTDFFFG